MRHNVRAPFLRQCTTIYALLLIFVAFLLVLSPENMNDAFVTEIDPLTTSTAVTEARAATYLGVFAVAMTVIVVCLIVVIDIVTLKQDNAVLRHNLYKRKFRRHLF